MNPAVPPELRRLFDRVTTIPVLLIGFVTVTVLAIWPLQPVDRALDERWTHRTLPVMVPFEKHVLDRISSQPVNLPVLVLVAVVVAWRCRSWRPLLLAVAAEAGFYVTGLLKLVFARPAPVLHHPAFFSGGLWKDGRIGVSFPSGHAVEAVLVYGTVVYLIRAYTHVSRRTVRWLHAVWCLEIVNCVVTSFTLGYHWASDLAGGVVLGALLLRTMVTLDRRWRRAEPERPIEARAVERERERTLVTH